MTLALDLVVATSNLFLTRVSFALTASKSVALDASCTSSAPMMESCSRLSLAQLILLLTGQGRHLLAQLHSERA